MTTSPAQDSEPEDYELQSSASERKADVDERIAELEAERARLLALVEQIPAGLMIFDPEGRVQTVNREALRILGVSEQGAGSIEDYGVFRGFRPDGSEYRSAEWPVARSLLSGEIVSGERFELIRGDGTRGLVALSSATVHDSSDQVVGAVALVVDVSARESLERVQRDFVTNAAHELQSPLTAILSAIDVLQAGAKDGPERDLFLGHIERAADRLSRLATALLILARAQIGLERPKSELVPLAPLLATVGQRLRPATGVGIEVSCPEDLAVLASEILLEQALLSLGDNAAKHTRQGQITLGARSVGDAVEITLTDSGPGIPEDEQPHVFSRFFRGIDAMPGGFGLGLAIVHAVAEALDGELQLESAVGSGTAVTLTLPKRASMVS